MKKHCLRYTRWGLLVLLLAGITVCRWNTSAGEWYALHVYPAISLFLSRISSVFLFSFDECLVVCVGIVLLLFPIWRRRKKEKWRLILLKECELLLWMYVWFYWGWGMTYFRADFFSRADVQPAVYDSACFKKFLYSYSDSLNKYYTAEPQASKKITERLIKDAYTQISVHYGLLSPRSFQHPKDPLFNTLYSRVGVLGFMGPFFSESHVNSELLPVEYPFTYAHELSHLLGVSSEAEANFWAYQVCIRCPYPYLRYSGYFGLLPYALVNARQLLEKSEFEAWIVTIRPEVFQNLRERNRYWDERYSRFLGSVQDKIYDFYLKKNKIVSGKKNYAEVISMVLSVRDIG